MKLEFVPVFFMAGKYNWWDGESGIIHNCGMISAGDGSFGIRASKSFSKPYPDRFKLYADSGGFQLSRGGYLLPEGVAEWQDEVQADVKFILDHPTRVRDQANANSAVNITTDGEFKVCLDETVDFAKRMIPKYKSLDGVFGVLHGVQTKDIETWRDSLLKVHDFKGWGIGIPSVKERAEGQLWFMLKCLAEVGIKRVHLFGFTDLPYIIQVALCLKRIGIDYCSFDSTRFIATRFSDVYYPVYENICSWFGRDEKREDLRMICDCPVCKKLKPNLLLDQGGPTNYVDFHYIMSMHNISHIQRFADTVAEYSKYDDLLYKVAEKYGLVLDERFGLANKGMSLMNFG